MPATKGMGVIGLAALLGALMTACGRSGGDAAHQAATVAGNCLDCHNAVDRVANLDLESLDFATPASQAETWEKIVRKLRAGMMPPTDGPRLDSRDRSDLIAWAENALDAAAAASPDPGRTEAWHRLNRAEYRNAVRDVLGVEIDVAELLPPDDSSYGFDNIAGVAKLSPTLLERYLAAADLVSRRAVGRAAPQASIDYFRVPDDRSQEQRLPGMPWGTRGGIRIRYTFPVDAEYEISALLARDLNEGMPSYTEDQDLEISIDGVRVAFFTLPGLAPGGRGGGRGGGGGGGGGRGAVAAPDGAPAAPPAAVPAAAPNGGNAPLAGDSRPGSDAPAQTNAAPAISQIAPRVNASFADRARRNEADRDWRVRVPVEAGIRDVTVTFIARTAALDETPRLPFQRPYPSGVNIPETRTGSYLRSVEIAGPYDVAGPGENLASRERLFVCEPATPVDVECATAILEPVVRLAYRRSVTAADIDPLLGFFRESAAAEGFDAGLALAIKRLLVAPEFLFRIEQDPSGLAPGATYALSDTSLASRLSFFLWSSVPDTGLLDLAESGRLGDPAVLEREVRRMLADPRADAFVENFAGQWLYLRNLDAIVPVQSRFPDFDDTLREGLRRETELFFAAILREDLSALDLLDADFTYMNERVARHYGVGGIKGSHFRRVALDADNPRRGLLGQGSILAVTSYPDRTSPVIRGKWILENLLGTPPPNPPDDVPALVSTDGAGSAISMRERLARHRDNPNCASCHALMDPLGFGLENFNATGQWRTLGDAGEAIDASGELPDGTAFDGAEGLREALLSSDLFVQTLTEKLMTYALGRGVEAGDMPEIRRIVRDAALDDYRLSALIMGVVESVPFRMRRSGA